MASPSAASCRTCSAAKSSCAARPASARAFTLYLPLKYVGPTAARRGRPTGTPAPRRRLRASTSCRAERPIEQIPDDRLDIQPGDTILLIVEDDPHYARIMIDLARDKGFKALLAMRGDDALDLAKQYQPTAVSLDVFLPDMLGWNVLSQLKQNPLTRHIPVQIITLDEDRQHGLARGAFSFVIKPTTPEGISDALAKIKDFAQPRRRRLLVVEDNKAEQMSIGALLGHDDIEIVNAGTGARGADDAAARALRLRGARSAAAGHVGLRGAGADAATTRRSRTFRWWSSPAGNCRPRRTRSFTPWRAASWSRAWNRRSGCSTRPRCSCIAWSPTCRPKSSACWSGSTARTRTWSGSTVLLVDDDSRNIFALSSVLERRGMKVLTATTGSEAIDLIESTPDLAIVLMDIMMPEMDGYQTIEKIRENPAYRRLPIVALTAKAMKGDREKCLEAGASDYLAKPVNTEQLLSALRMWLHR